MFVMEFSHRIATEADTPAIRVLMDRAIESLQRPFLSPHEVAASRLSMGLDSQLIADRTYFLVEMAGRLVGCGGWSRRATLYAAITARRCGTRNCLSPRRMRPGFAQCTPIRISPGAAWAGSCCGFAKRLRGRLDLRGRK